jgi:dTDP-4-dehydrorhamnose 3,5-epimerase
MKVTPLKIPEVKTIEPNVFEDKRGFFYESFNQKKFNDALGESILFVQDNHSMSAKGVLRGLHFQDAPFTQGKLVRVVAGKVFDVAVDIRKESPSYGQWVSAILSDRNKKQLWIPPGFAHGFLTLSNDTEIIYKVTNFYSKEHDISINPFDQSINITWPLSVEELIISEKDMNGKFLKDL